MLMSGKTLLQEDEKGKEMHFASVGKPKVILTSTNLEDLPEEIQNLLNGFADITVDELPNKAAYRLTRQENAKV